MCEDYKKECPSDNGHNVLGVSINREYYHIPKKLMGKYKSKKMTNKDWESLKRENQTGMVFLCFEHCSAGIATHELMHASISSSSIFLRVNGYWSLSRINV